MGVSCISTELWLNFYYRCLLWKPFNFLLGITVVYLRCFGWREVIVVQGMVTAKMRKSSTWKQKKRKQLWTKPTEAIWLCGRSSHRSRLVRSHTTVLLQAGQAMHVGACSLLTPGSRHFHSCPKPDEIIVSDIFTEVCNYLRCPQILQKWLN